MLISFAARGLSSISTQLFCYTAVSSAAIIGILPGYLIRTCFAPGLPAMRVDHEQLAALWRWHRRTS